MFVFFKEKMKSNISLSYFFFSDSLRKHHPQGEDQLPHQQVTGGEQQTISATINWPVWFWLNIKTGRVHWFFFFNLSFSSLTGTVKNWKAWKDTNTEKYDFHQFVNTFQTLYGSSLQHRVVFPPPNWAKLGELGQTEQSGLEEPQFSPVCQNSRRKKKEDKGRGRGRRGQRGSRWWNQKLPAGHLHNSAFFNH